MRLLICAHRSSLLDEVTIELRAFSHDVMLSHETPSIEEAAKADLVILSLDLPSCQGWKFLRDLRSCGCTVPLLAIDSDGNVGACVRALDLGADRYLKMPFGARELRALSMALFRSCNQQRRLEVQNGLLAFEADGRIFYLNDKRIYLTATESALLEILMRRSGRVVKKQELLNQFCRSKSCGYEDAIYQHIHRIRQKVGRDSAQIESIRGIGYRMRKLPSNLQSSWSS